MLLEFPGITLPLGGRVRWRYELRGGRWMELAYDGERLREGPRPVTFDIVLGKMPTEELRDAARRIEATRTRIP